MPQLPGAEHGHHILYRGGHGHRRMRAQTLCNRGVLTMNAQNAADKLSLDYQVKAKKTRRALTLECRGWTVDITTVPGGKAMFLLSRGEETKMAFSYKQARNIIEEGKAWV